MDKGRIEHLLKILEKVKEYVRTYELRALLILLLLVFLFFIFSYFFVSDLGASFYIVAILAFLFFALILYIYFPFFKKSTWAAFMGFFASGLFFLGNLQSKREERIVETKADSIVIYEKHTIEKEISIPFLFKYRETNVHEAKSVNTGVESSYNPIEIHYIMGEMSITDDKLDYYYDLLNDIIGRYEKDSIHFSLEPMYLSERWDWFYRYRGLPVSLHLYEEDSIHSPLKPMYLSEQRDWCNNYYSTLPTPLHLYECYHNQYLDLISAAYFNRGVVYDRLGYPEKALEDYDRALNNPNSHFKWNGNDRKFRWKINQALAYSHLKNYGKALDILDNVETYSDSYSYAELQFYKGYVYLLMKDYNQAISCYEKAINSREPYSYYDYRKIYNYLGITYNQIGDSDKAIKAFTEAIQLVLNDGENYKEFAIPYYYNRSLVYRDIGKNDLADSDEEAIKQIEEEKEKSRQSNKSWLNSYIYLNKPVDVPFRFKRWW